MIVFEEEIRSRSRWELWEVMAASGREVELVMAHCSGCKLTLAVGRERKRELMIYEGFMSR